MEIQYGGAILDLPAGSEQDYRLGSDTQYRGIPIKMLPSIVSNDVSYNQLEFKEFGRNMCTLYAGMIMHTNNSNSPIPLPLRQELGKVRYNMPDFDPNVGGYLQVGVKCVIDGLRDGIMYRVHKTDFKTLLDKGYVVNFGMYVGIDTSKSVQDGVFTNDEIAAIKNARNGHSTCLRKNVRINSYEGVINNNKVTIEDIDKFIASWFVYDWGYLIVPNKVLRDFYNSLLDKKTYKQATEYFAKIDKELYPREKQIFQWCLQMKYIGKINSDDLKNIRF